MKKLKQKRDELFLGKNTNIVSVKARIHIQVCLILEHKALWQQASSPKYIIGSSNERNTLKIKLIPTLIQQQQEKVPQYPLKFGVWTHLWPSP